MSNQNGRTPDAAWTSAEDQPGQAALPDGKGSLSEDPPEVHSLRRQLLELATTNAKLSHENTSLSEAIMARDAFLAVAAHELRNPMTPIRGRVQLLRRMLQRSGDDKDALVVKMDKGLEQVEGLIEQYIKRATTLLEVSRATTGQLHLDLVAVDLCALVRRSRKAWRRLPIMPDPSLRSVSLPVPSHATEIGSRSSRSSITCSRMPSSTVLASQSW